MRPAWFLRQRHPILEGRIREDVIVVVLNVNTEPFQQELARGCDIVFGEMARVRLTSKYGGVLIHLTGAAKSGYFLWQTCGRVLAEKR